MLTASRFPSKKNFAGTLQPVLPLIPEAAPKRDEEKTLHIALDLKVRAGGDNNNTYKKYIRKFEAVD